MTIYFSSDLTHPPSYLLPSELEPPAITQVLPPESAASMIPRQVASIVPPPSILNLPTFKNLLRLYHCQGSALGDGHSRGAVILGETSLNCRAVSDSRV